MVDAKPARNLRRERRSEFGDNEEDAASVIEATDPRPAVRGGAVLGSVCETCGQPSAWRGERCSRCLLPTRDAEFGPAGTVWSAATVWLTVGDRRPPFTLAYVDLHDGPRVLVLVDADGEPPPGTAVEITGTDGGDIVVRPS